MHSECETEKLTPLIPAGWANKKALLIKLDEKKGLIRDDETLCK